MTLTLDIVGPQASQLGAAARKVFKAAGGTIGRAADNDWVIPDAYISGHHARIHFRDGRYLLEDTSTNGVFVKTPGNRLTKGEFYTLQSGDRVFIDAYEIKVTVAELQTATSAASPLSDLFGPNASPSPAPSSAALPIPDDPFGFGDPFAPPASSPRPLASSRDPAQSPLGGAGMGEQFAAESVADPLVLLGLGDKPKPSVAPKAADLARHSPLSDHFTPPDITTPLAEPSPAIADALIPDDYDPLSDLRPASPIPSPAIAPRPTPGGARPTSTPAKPVVPVGNTPTAAPMPKPAVTKAPPPPAPTVAAAAPAPTPASAPVTRSPAPAPPTIDTAATQTQRAAQFDLAALLVGAGIPAAQLTPELAENFGRILQIVVAGLMDVLRSRERIKDEFRMRMTTFKTADNNPLKFSANVDDALHNLLVKRNAAYLGPVEAFEDAFRDVRNHQMAMLAGMRVAFDAMLHSFEPDQLQEHFNKQLKRGALLAVPAKLRYWDLYREWFHDMVKDPEATFRELFGEEFAKAYEEQLERLKLVSRNQKS